MKLKKIKIKYLPSVPLLILIFFSGIAFSQSISNKLDLNLLYGSVMPLGSKAGQIDGISVPTHFALAKGGQSQALRLSYNYNQLLSFGLNLGMFKLENAKLKPSPETFDLIEISPVLTLKKKIFVPFLEVRVNLMPLLSSYKSSIYAGDIAYKNSKSEENWIKTSQFVPGMKTSIGLSCRIKDSFGVMVEGGAAFFSDNQKLTSETTNFYYFAQIGISYSLFYNKRFYLTHE
jgi:hypothetical protein